MRLWFHAFVCVPILRPEMQDNYSDSVCQFGWHAYLVYSLWNRICTWIDFNRNLLSLASSPYGWLAALDSITTGELSPWWILHEILRGKYLSQKKSYTVYLPILRIPNSYAVCLLTFPHCLCEGDVSVKSVLRTECGQGHGARFVQGQLRPGFLRDMRECKFLLYSKAVVAPKHTFPSVTAQEVVHIRYILQMQV